MSVTPSPIGGFAAQFFDNNGVILSGGKIYTYAAGTTTPQAVYTSASGATPHANPIILDSAGRVPGGEIWLTDGLVYKFVIETATAILIGTYDNITGINSNFVNYTIQEEVITATAGQTVFNLTTINYTPATNSLTVYIDGVNQYVGDSYIETDSDTVTFTSGVHVGGEVKFTTAIQTTTGAVDASIVTYDPPFAGGVITNVEDKLAQYVSVADFGADNTGVADSTAAFDAAETYLGTVGGGIMFVPPGTYKINWVCTTENIIVQGSGGRGEYDDTCIRPYSLASAPITIGNGTAYVRYVSLLDCHVSGSDGSVSGETTAANNAPQAILLNGGTVNFHADRCVFYNGLKTVSLVPSVTLPVTTNVFLNSTIRNDLTDSANARAIYIIRLADPGYATANKFIATKLNGPTLGYAAEIDGTVAGITFEVNDSYWDIKPAKGVLLKGASGIVCHNFQIDPGTTAAIIIETDNNGDIARFISGLLRHGGQKFQTPAYTYDIPAEADIFSYRQRALSPFLGNDVVFSTTADPYNTSVNLSLQSSTGPLAFYGANFTPGVNNSQSIGNSTQRWSNVYGYNIRAGDGTAFWTTGTGSPEGVVTAPVGSIFTRLNGGALTTLYIKESGAGNTGWVAK